MPGTDDLRDLKLRFGGRLVEQLGAQMYPSATATVAELISNAWDADAKHVWVQMPFGDWANGEIVVTDDGLGMSHDEAAKAYLVVGRNRREGGKQRSPGNRLVHGRKGIGKLAAFGTATILELRTQKVGHPAVAFRLDYDKIRKQDPDKPYQVEPSQDDGLLVDPLTGDPLEKGTRIRLTGLRLKRRLDPEHFLRSMSRRFALNEHEMVVFVNGERLRRFELDLDVRFPPDRVPPEARVEDGWAVETLSNGEEVKWWIGFTPTPLRGEAEQGVSVLVRGKLAQRPFKFERNTGGTTGQLGQEYLVGEVVADWIDDEDRDEVEDPDYIQSNRDQLQLEDPDLYPFLDWGRRRLRWALAERDKIKSERASQEIQQIVPLGRMLEDFSARERRAFYRVAEEVRRIPEVDDDALVRVMGAVVEARETETARALAQEISMSGGSPSQFWMLLRQLAALDARSARTFVEARLDTLAQLSVLPVEGDLAERVRQLLWTSPGLLDPIWEACEPDDYLSADVAPGVAVFVLRDPLRADAATLVAVIDGADLAAVRGSLAALANADVARLVVIADDAAEAEFATVGEVTTWRSLIANSEGSHQSWLDVLHRRASQELPETSK